MEVLYSTVHTYSQYTLVLPPTPLIPPCFSLSRYHSLFPSPVSHHQFICTLLTPPATYKNLRVLTGEEGLKLLTLPFSHSPVTSFLLLINSCLLSFFCYISFSFILRTEQKNERSKERECVEETEQRVETVEYEETEQGKILIKGLRRSRER